MTPSAHCSDTFSGKKTRQVFLSRRTQKKIYFAGVVPKLKRTNVFVDQNVFPFPFPFPFFPCATLDGARRERRVVCSLGNYREAHYTCPPAVPPRRGYQLACALASPASRTTPRPVRAKTNAPRPNLYPRYLDREGNKTMEMRF